MANSHGSNADIFANGYQLSPFLNSFSQQGQRDTAETTTFGKTSKTYIPGLKDATLSAGGYFDGATAAVDEMMWAALGQSANSLVSYIPEGADAAANLGNTSYTLDSIETSYEVTSGVGDVNQISAEFGAGDTGNFTRGKVSHVFQLEAAPGNTASLDYGLVSSAAGGYLVVHATAAASLVVFLQDSADNSTFADLAGSLNMGSVRGSARLALPTTIRRYTRVRWTGTGTFIALFERF